jgi:hypothetical protein
MSFSVETAWQALKCVSFQQGLVENVLVVKFGLITPCSLPDAKPVENIDMNITKLM